MLHNTRLFSSKVRVAVAHGDGIGPEIMKATLRILNASAAPISAIPVEMGKEVYEKGVSSGVSDEAWKIIKDTKLLLKAPITTPRGGGVKSLNVTMRKTLGLFANVRPCVSYSPFVPSNYPKTNMVIVRENEEDTYGGIEHRQTAEVTQCLKLITQPGSERIIRYAFNYAVANNRKKVTCLTKSNIMKITDGLFEQIFNQVAKEFPQIKAEHMIIDIGAAKIAVEPEHFDVVVTPNLYGDIVSDIAAEVVGSVGLAGSANIGEDFAMFEAIHGSAPDIAGKNIANPSGLLCAAAKMLAHVGHLDHSDTIYNAWLKTLEDGIHTGDIYEAGRSKQLVGTVEFADAVIQRLGSKPTSLHHRRFGQTPVTPVSFVKNKPVKTLVGVDVFVDWAEAGRDPAKLAVPLQKAGEALGLKLSMISNRGTKVWPGDLPATTRVDHWRCRFLPSGAGSKTLSSDVVPKLLQNVTSNKVDFVKIENLYEFDGVAGYSKGQGE
eukprot:comp21359_c0_seq1/m.46005 comp21359_c0_seq1/g.46005  ORF comp21359_c0_seq1/g.46005 comp21359_c0_seq1/m.46005 type:complete len:492 (+) comp21359_c0_seq1:246-1721(+)